MNYVFFHKNCMDGAGSKYAAWKKFGENAVYHEVQYGDTFPEHDYQLDDHIYILDFSFSKEVLLDIASKCHVTVVDHHDTAMQELKDLPFAIFDMSKSGAVLSWEYFHPEIPVPYFLLILQDYDLWNWKLKETLDLTSRFQSDIQRLDSQYMDALINDCQTYYRRTYESGESELQMNLFDQYLQLGAEAASAMKKEMDSLINKKKYTIKNIDGKNVAIFNTTMYYSMLGHTACSIGDVDYSMSYFVKEDGAAVFSFRSKKNGHDVGQVAKRLGGGGHKSSSGAVVPFPRSFEVLRDIYEMDSVA